MKSKFRAALALSAMIIGGNAAAKTPPPPPAIFHGNPGPYVVYFGEGGTDLTNGARKIIHSAFSNWRTPEYGVFVLCYNAESEGENGMRLRYLRMMPVRNELLRRGAKQVLYSQRDCHPSEAPVSSDHARVTILGIIDPLNTR